MSIPIITNYMFTRSPVSFVIDYLGLGLLTRARGCILNIFFTSNVIFTEKPETSVFWNLPHRSVNRGKLKTWCSRLYVNFFGQWFFQRKRFKLPLCIATFSIPRHQEPITLNKFENVVIVLQLGVLSKLIRHEKRRFSQKFFYTVEIRKRRP